MINVLIVDDHPVAREGLRRVLEQYDDICVTADTGDGQSALEMVALLHPDVVLMDIRMPGVNGLEITRQIKAESPRVSIIIMTNYEDDVLMMDTIRVGASGFLLKDATRALLLHTIHAVAAGGLLVDATVLRQALATGALSRPRMALQSPAVSEPLRVSERDAQLLQLLAEGRTNREIAVVQGLPEQAAKKQIQAVVSSLNATNRTHAVAIAVRLGLIS